jgi:hypothetical protein
MEVKAVLRIAYSNQKLNQTSNIKFSKKDNAVAALHFFLFL